MSKPVDLDALATTYAMMSACGVGETSTERIDAILDSAFTAPSSTQMSRKSSSALSAGSPSSPKAKDESLTVAIINKERQARTEVVKVKKRSFTPRILHAFRETFRRIRGASE